MNDPVAQTIDYISEAWSGTDRPHLRRVISGLASGRAVSPDTLELSGPVPADEQLKRAGARFDDDGNIIGIGGVGFGSANHSVSLAGVELSACCAITAQGVAILADQIATIRTRDPVTNGEITMTVTPEGVESVEPKATVATFVTLRTAGRRATLFDTFCRFARYFESRESAREFDTGDSETLILDPDETHRAARLWVATVWGDGSKAT